MFALVVRINLQAFQSASTGGSECATKNNLILKYQKHNLKFTLKNSKYVKLFCNFDHAQPLKHHLKFVVV